jgi:preprotein translocase subunit SecA
MVAFLSHIFKANSRLLNRYWATAKTINELEPTIQSLDDAGLKAKTSEFRVRLEKGETLDNLLPEAFAVVREASLRTLGQRHFDVQLIGGMVLHEGRIAEMRTGEGKTLVATLAVYLNALTSKGVHVVTVNDYLARRDAVWMGQIYNFLGLSLGVITGEGAFLYDPTHVEKDEERDEKGSFKVVHDFLRPVETHEAYSADVTYGYNNEFGFDYLRDNLEYEASALRQREFNFAVVDEIDSILIDEARTPLIVSAPVTDSESLYKTFADISGQLVAETDFEIDEKRRQIALTDEGIDKVERLLGVENIYTDKGVKYVLHLENAVRAKALFHKDKEYVINDGKVVIVDEFTGRLQPGRRWSGGLHEAVEAKEGVLVQRESRTFASITFQNYFRMYKKLSGMTGTAKTSAEEFFKVYGLEVIEIPTNQKIARIDRNDFIFQTELGKFKAVARKVQELQEKGQPVLIGTASVEKNQLLSTFLTTQGIKHEALNAKNHEREGEIVAQAGRKGAVTLATNMAGRGVDIKLGGNPTTPEISEEVKNLGGLFVLGTERHEARRIDNQLRGRSGRQGDNGETQFFVSLEDQLMRVFASEMIGKMMGRFGIPEDEPIQNSLITRSLEKAQEKIEGFNFDARKNILEYDDILNQQRRSIYNRRRSLLTGDNTVLEAELERMLSDAKPEIKDAITLKRQALGDDAFFKALRRLMIQTSDLLWVDHLEVMEYLRDSVRLRAYGQRDPLVEYKREGLRLFREMEEDVIDKTLELIPHIQGEIIVDQPVQLDSVHEGAASITKQQKGTAHSTKEDHIGRNEVVTITKDGKEETMKFKKAEPLLKQGWHLKQ